MNSFPLRWLLGISLLGLSCQEPAETDLGQQPAIQVYLAVHVEPLSRESVGGCEDPVLSECGLPVADSWERRTDNLAWLMETWSDAERTMDLQIGPEMALSWTGDSALEAALVSSFGTDGDRDGVALSEGEAVERVETLSESARATLGWGLENGSMELGVHVHSVLPDTNGSWGTAPKRSAGESITPCLSWSEEPLAEGGPVVVEKVVAYGVESVSGLAQQLGTDLLSFTGHLPRTMAGKIAVIEAPDTLDPDASADFSSLFKPTNLSSAYSECLHAIGDHPPLEPWPADSFSALARGDGPVVVPGERVVGFLDEHLDHWADTSASAAARRWIQMLLNWRHAGLMGEEDRPWAYTFHTHLYQLNPGSPGPLDPSARESNTREGGMLRGDLEALSGLLDRGVAAHQFGGVSSRSDSIVEWIQPSQLESGGSGFSYGSTDEAPMGELQADSFPYLYLVADRLDSTHLVCEGEVDGVAVLGFSRCLDGWVWARKGPGYSCADGSPPEGVFVLLPTQPSCLRVDSATLQVAELDELSMGAPKWCGGEAIEVPVVGLIVEPSTGLNWMSDSCATWR